jgi:hypothetical protein
MRRAFEAYQYVMPAVLTPLAAVLWWRHYGEAGAALAVLALLAPIAHAYVVPAIGTNVLGVWEFDTRLRLGRFRPHHGFVFGSATAMLVLLTIGPPTPQPTSVDVLRAALLTGALLGAVNWLYDVAALRAGFLRVYNQPWAEGRGAAAIATDYAPWFFGVYGLIHGGGLKLAEGALVGGTDIGTAVAVGGALLAATTVLPTLGYVAQSYLRHGHHGCRPVLPPTGGQG